MARYSDKQNQWTQDYIKRAYDSITFRAPKGNREIYNEFAKSRGKSLNSIIVELLKKEMEKDNDNKEGCLNSSNPVEEEFKKLGKAL